MSTLKIVMINLESNTTPRSLISVPGVIIELLILKLKVMVVLFCVKLIV